MVVDLDLLPLRTQGNQIVDRHGERFQLKCVAWYGSQDRLFVANGLHKRNLTSIVASIVSFGFNCVRLPFSLELYHRNPMVPSHAVIAEPAWSSSPPRALEAYDEILQRLTTDAGLLVVVDQHNTYSGWCCDAWANDSLWFNEDYSVDSWMDALRGMARRYRFNPRVVAIELRNEIRDNGQGLAATWSKQDDPNGMVWPDAAASAGDAVLEENPNLLVMVTALCFGSDLRGARQNPVTLQRQDRLVWVVHMYEWFFMEYSYQNQIGGFAIYENWTLVGCVFLLVAVTTFSIVVVIVHRKHSHQSLGPAFAWMVIQSFVALAIIGGVTLRILGHFMPGPACWDFKWQDALPINSAAWGLFLSGLVVAMMSWFIQAWRRRRRSLVKCAQPPQKPEPEAEIAGWFNSLPAAAPLLLLMICWSTLVLSLTAFTAQAEWRLHRRFDELFGFALEEGQAYTAPVFLSEFGTDRVDAPFWQGLVRYVTKHNMDFAYWPLNGEKWDSETEQWGGESYGLLAADWSSPHQPERVHGLGLGLNL